MSTYSQIIRHSGTYSLSLAVVKLSGIFLLPIYTRYLTTADYGTMELLDLTSYMLVLLLGVRMGDALAYFYFAATDSESRKVAVSTALIGATLLSLAGGSLALLFAKPISVLVFRSPDQQGYYRLVFLALMCSIPLEVGMSYLRVVNKSKQYAAFQICRGLLTITLNLVFLMKFRMGITALLAGTCISTGVSCIGMLGALFWNVGWRFDRSLCRRQIAYSIPIGLSGCAMIIVHYGDRFFLVRSVPLSAIGVYALAYKIGMLVSVLYEPFSMYWNSQVYAILQRPSGPGVYVRVLTYLTLVLTAAAALLVLFARPALTLLVTPAFREAYHYIPLIAAAYVLRGVGDHLRRIFFVEGKTVLETRIAFVAAFTCLICYALLIPAFKVWGAAIATLIAFSVICGYSAWLAQRVRRFDVEVRRLAQIGLTAVAVAAACIVLSPAAFSAQVAIGVAGAAIFAALLWAFGFLDEEERARLRQLAGAFGADKTGVGR